MQRVMRSVLAAGLVALGAAAAGAQAAEGDTSGEEAGATAIELAQDLDLTWRLPAYEWDYDGAAKRPSARDLFGIRVEAGDLKLVGEIDAAVRPSSAGGLVDADIGPGENALYWSPGSARLGFGWQYFSWGAADKRNPTDKLNARDYTAGLEAKKLPAFALSATWYFAEGASLQCVAKPVPEASVFPVDFRGQAQAGIDAFNAAFNALVPGASAAGAASTAEPPDVPESLVAGGRLSFAMAAADFSLSYLYDWDEYYAPDIALAGYLGRYYPASVSLHRPRVHRVGADVKTIVGPAGLWLEAALGWPEGYSSGSYSLRRPSIDWTAGTDLSFGPNDAFYLNLQYIGQYALDYDRSFSSDYPGGRPAPARMTDEAYMMGFFERSMVQKLAGQSEGLLQGVSASLKLPVPDSAVTPSLTALCLVPFLYDDAGGDRYCSIALKPEIDIAPADSFHIVVGAELCYAWAEGPDGTPSLETESDRLGVKTKDNNVYITARYSWNSRAAK